MHVLVYAYAAVSCQQQAECIMHVSSEDTLECLPHVDATLSSQLTNIREERISAALQSIQQAATPQNTTAYYHLTNSTPVTVSCWALSGIEVQWHHDGNRLANGSCNSIEQMHEKILLRRHPKYQTGNHSNMSGAGTSVELHRYTLTATLTKAWSDGVGNESATLTCHATRQHGEAPDGWLTRNFTLDAQPASGVGQSAQMQATPKAGMFW